VKVVKEVRKVETIVIPIETNAFSKSKLFEDLALQLNGLVGESLKGHEGYVASKVLSVVIGQAEECGGYWEIYGLAVVEVKLEG